MFSASIVDALAVRSCGRKVSGACPMWWWQSPNPVVDTGSQASRSPGRSWRQKLRVWEEFGEAMEEDYQSVGLEEILGKPSGASEGGSSTLPTLFTVQGGELLTSTEDIDIVGRWKKILRGSPQSHRLAFQ
ncbi:hypothetical protein L3Q82_001893 [Scortum barcoo]|uniref:Uncharacterized protein n=1 Tax=Scortum barcoo TaxID=214431 RepID=A0ACB8W561_9TELE|nr:hypothetical protein L3Q82_001893 [Scortum barcoo]